MFHEIRDGLIINLTQIISLYKDPFKSEDNLYLYDIEFINNSEVSITEEEYLTLRNLLNGVKHAS